MKNTRERLAWLWGYWRPHWRFGLFLLLFTVVASVVTVAYPLVIRNVVDGMQRGFASGDARREALARWLGILGLIAFGRLLAGFYPGFRAWMNMVIDKGVRDRLFGSILGKGHRFFTAYRTGDVVTRLTDDIAEYPRIAWFACSGIYRFVDSFTRFALCVGAMVMLDARLALLSLAPVPLMLLVFYFARRELGETARRQQEAISRTNNALESAFGGIRIVKAFNGQAGQEHRLRGILEERIGIQFNLARLVVLVHQMDNIVARMGQVVVLAVGGLQVLDGTLSLGTLYAFYVFLDMLIHPMMDLPNLFVTARQAFVSIDRVDEVIRYPEPAHAGAAAPDPLTRLELRDVAFRYAPDLPPALEGVTLSVEAGRKVAVVGAVGSGKSTLLRLVAGLLRPERGAYLVNGADFDAWDWSRLRHHIGYVPQESLLFSETILDNVSFGRDVDEARAVECLETAQMAPDLEQMPKGVQTQLGRTGTLVSGGQKQRIAIARALAGRPDVLLLDDCTSSLDARNEDRFWQRLAETSPDTAVLVVSHRPTTIRRADHIVVLDRGRLVDQGTHAELAGRCAPYREFLVAEERRERLQ